MAFARTALSHDRRKMTAVQRSGRRGRRLSWKGGGRDLSCCDLEGEEATAKWEELALGIEDLLLFRLPPLLPRNIHGCLGLVAWVAGDFERLIVLVGIESFEGLEENRLVV